MTKSFSLRSDAIPYFLGVSLLRADQIVLISPWISDIDVVFPVTDQIHSRSLSLVEAVHEFPEKHYTIITSDDPHNEYLIDRVEDVADVEIIENLHAKAIVTDDLVYIGSANITKSGMSTNVELAHVIENDYEDTAAFVKEELQIEV